MEENHREPRSPIRIALEEPSCEDRRINNLVKHYVQTTVATFGGWNELLAGEQALLLSQKACLTAILKAQRDISRLEEILDSKGKPSGLYWLLRCFTSEFRSNQVALGLARPRITARRPQDKVGAPRDTVQDIIDEYAEEKRRERKARVV